MAANLIQAAGGNAKAAHQAVETLLRKQPKVEGSGAGQVYLAPETARLFDQAEQVAKKAGDSFVTVERLLLALASSNTDAGKALKDAGVDAAGAERRHRGDAQGPHRPVGLGRGGLRRAQEVHPRPDRGRARRQARPGDRPRRGDPPRHPGPLAPHQEQPGADRRARRRQDRDRRGAGPAHRQRRRAGIPAGPPAPVARPRRPRRRRQVPRRVRGAAEGAAAGGQPRRAATSSCSSTSCTRWSAPARPKGRWTPPTCSSRRWRAASCTASAPPRWTSTASTSRRTRRWPAASSRSSSASRAVEDTISILRGLKEKLRGAPQGADHRRCDRRRGRRCPTATSPTASCPTRRSTWSTRRRPASAWRSTASPRRSTSSTAASSSSGSRRRRCSKETDRASQDRLERLRKELAELEQRSAELTAQWQAEKEQARRASPS